MYGLTPRDLNWALDTLEGKVTETQTSLTGKFRRVRLLPHWESQQGEAEVSRAAKKSRTARSTPSEEGKALMESARTHPVDPAVELLLRELGGDQSVPGNDSVNNHQEP